MDITVSNSELYPTENRDYFKLIATQERSPQHQHASTIAERRSDVSIVKKDQVMVDNTSYKGVTNQNREAYYWKLPTHYGTKVLRITS